MPRRKRFDRHQHHDVPEFNPLSDEQAAAYELCFENDITFLTGPAGCSKSYTAIAFAVDCLLSDQVDKIVLTRPAIEACGEALGFLPGTAVQKLGCYMTPLHDNLQEYAEHHMAKIKGHMEIAPLAFMRGRTIKDSVLVLDEAQNATMSQLKMLLTRIGPGTRMVLCGDADQADIRDTPLMLVARTLSQIPRIAHLHFSQTSGAIRHPLIPSIINGFSACAER